jgi:hypothetical protein
MALITRRRLIRGGLAAAGIVAAPAILRAAENEVAKGMYWIRVPASKDKVYAKHLVPDVFHLEFYAPPNQTWSVTYHPDNAASTTVTAAPFGNGDTKSPRPNTYGALGCVTISLDRAGGRNDLYAGILNKWPPQNIYNPLELNGPGRFAFAANFPFPPNAEGSGAIWVACWVKGLRGQYPHAPDGWPFAAVPSPAPNDDF